MPAPTDTIRVEKGTPTDEELAALALVLMARTAAAPAAGDEPPAPTPRWQPPGHAMARSWRHTTPAGQP
ncbi:acyl-CoA carboxylase epsilon subunit [Streptomyces sp. NPDC001606]